MHFVGYSIGRESPSVIWLRDLQNVLNLHKKCLRKSSLFGRSEQVVAEDGLLIKNTKKILKNYIFFQKAWEKCSLFRKPQERPLPFKHLKMAYLQMIWRRFFTTKDLKKVCYLYKKLGKSFYSKKVWRRSFMSFENLMKDL